jgi:ABC-type Zn uptake system ZnuABC Zn-binding protein ZnuA/ABC-type Mn2+/Zn2+ transport system permease subunit
VSDTVFAPFHYAFVQRGAVELLLLSVGAGLLGTWIVLRGLAFYSHGVATAAFPGLVLADGLGFAAPLGAFGAAVAFAFLVERLAHRRRQGHDTLTALVLVGSLALGVILASDVFHSQSNVETLLFGSVLAVGNWDLAFAGAVSAFVLLAAVVFAGRWLAVGFDAASARALGVRGALTDAVLLLTIALAVTSALAAVGTMLTSALYVVPAATTRLLIRNLRTWQLTSVGLAALEGVAGLWLSVEANVPPGAAIAVLAGGVFALAALARAKPRLLLAGATALLLAGCGGTSGHRGVVVVATTTQIGDWAREVGGDAVTVHQLLQPNTDPHEYEPRPEDVVTTAGADVVFESGIGLDQWMGKVVSRSGGHPDVVVLGDRVPVMRKDDPHWWHDPRNAEAAVRVIAQTLERADAAHRDVYARNAARYLRTLRMLDQEIAVCFEQVPRAQRKLVTSHDAFGYFAARYGITIVGAVIPSQTTQAQPSAGDVARLIAQIRREHVKAVFPESSINPRLAEQIARETGASAKYRLYGDTLGPKGSTGATYVSMEHANADQIVRGLTGGRAGCT